MAPATGGTETSKQSTWGGTLTVGELTSQGLSVNTAASIPATPTGNGWVFLPGAGSYANANWSFIMTLSFAVITNQTSITVRFFKYTGTYASIGTIVLSPTFATAKTVYTWTATSMPLTTFGATDLLYVDAWVTGSASLNSHNPTVWESTTASQGVASDVQVTTSTFTPSGGHLRIMDGYGGVFS